MVQTRGLDSCFATVKLALVHAGGPTCSPPDGPDLWIRDPSLSDPADLSLQPSFLPPRTFLTRSERSLGAAAEVSRVGGLLSPPGPPAPRSRRAAPRSADCHKVPAGALRNTAGSPRLALCLGWCDEAADSLAAAAANRIEGSRVIERLSD